MDHWVLGTADLFKPGSAVTFGSVGGQLEGCLSGVISLIIPDKQLHHCVSNLDYLYLE